MQEQTKRAKIASDAQTNQADNQLKLVELGLKQSQNKTENAISMAALHLDALSKTHDSSIDISSLIRR